MPSTLFLVVSSLVCFVSCFRFSPSPLYKKHTPALRAHLVEYEESWDDGEIPWEFDLPKRKYVIWEYKKKLPSALYNTNEWENTIVEWETGADPKESVSREWEQFVPYNKEDAIIWDFVQEMKQNEMIQQSLKIITEQLTASENILNNLLNLKNTNAEFEVLLSAVVLLISVNHAKDKDLVPTGPKPVSTKHLLFMTMLFLLTKGVEPAA